MMVIKYIINHRRKQLNAIKNKEELNPEEQEQKELIYEIEQLLASIKNPIYFIDLQYSMLYICCNGDIDSKVYVRYL